MLFNPRDESQKSSDMTTGEPNPGDVSTDLPEPMLIIPQLPDVEPAPTKTYHSDNTGTRNIYIRKTDLEKFGCPPKFTVPDCRCPDRDAPRNAGNDLKT